MIEVVKLSDIYKRGNVYWFNKRIPADLQKHFGGRKQEQFSLKTKDRDVALRKAQEKRDEWDALRSAHRPVLSYQNHITFGLKTGQASSLP